jgi:ketosteroid isomerase-like protein
MSDEAILEQLERDWVGALTRADAAALDGIWDDGFIFTDPDGRTLSRKECLRGLGSGDLAIESAEILRVRVRTFGDTGVVLGFIALKGRAGEMSYDGEYDFLDVYARRDGRWRAVLSSGERAKRLLL